MMSRTMWAAIAAMVVFAEVTSFLNEKIQLCLNKKEQRSAHPDL